MFRSIEFFAKTVLCAFAAVLLFQTALAQGSAKTNLAVAKAPPGPKVTQIDIEGLKTIIKPNGKPLLINFWATWCDPCREEFPDLVKLNAAYRGKIDFLTVSLDDLADINGGVPKFLSEMKSDIPAYLLKTPDESAAIALVAKDWAGNLPLTILFTPKGDTAYMRNGKIRLEILKENLDRVLGSPPVGAGVIATFDFVKIKGGMRDEARYFYENNWRAYRDAAFKRGLIDSYEYVEASSEKDANFDLMLITRYKGEEQFKNSEAAFGPIIKELTPNGPYLKGTSKPDDFRQVVFSYTGKSPFVSAR